jgi:hypothetical protein
MIDIIINRGGRMYETPPRPIAVRRRVACAMIGEGTSKLDELISTGKIEARKSGRNLLIIVASLEAYVAGLPVATLNIRYNKKQIPTGKAAPRAALADAPAD